MALPSHLFVSDIDGALYDTRVPNWSKLAPLRRVYGSRTRRGIADCAQLKAALRYGKYTSLGCYPLYFVTSDGKALSFEAVRSELRQVMQSIRDKANDGWRVVAVDVNYEDSDLYCAHTSARIESAYGVDSDDAGEG